MSRDTRDPREIINHVIASRVALSSTIYGLSAVELMTQGAVGNWSVKDVMAHIGRWEEICFDQLQKHLGGEVSIEDYRDALAYNDKWEAELQLLTLQEAIGLFETSHYRLFGLLSSLKSEQWNGYIRAWVRGSTWHHFEEHGEQIRVWRAGR
jgi:DinB family protein